MVSSEDSLNNVLLITINMNMKVLLLKTYIPKKEDIIKPFGTLLHKATFSLRSVVYMETKASISTLN